MIDQHGMLFFDHIMIAANDQGGTGNFAQISCWNMGLVMK